MGKANDNSDHYEGALLEEISDNVKQLAESMSGLASKLDTVDSRLTRVEKNTEPVPAIKAAIIEQSGQLSNHENRIVSLENTTT